MVADVRSLDPAVAIDNAGKTRSPDYARGVRCRRSASSGKMLRRTVRQCRKGAYTRKRGKQRCAAFRRGYVQGGRERVRDKRARGEDRNRDVMMRACPSERIEQMVEPPRSVELRAVAAGCAYRSVAQVQADADHVRLTRIGETDAPGPPVGVTANSANFAAAHIAKGSIAAVLAQDVRDAVSDITLRYTIKCHAHSGALQHDPTRADIDRLPVDELACALDGFRCWPLRRRRSVAEKMSRIKCP